VAADDVEWDGDRVSAVTGAGIPELVGRLAVLVDEARAAEPDAGAYVVYRPEPEGIRVERDVDGALVVRGQAAERAVAVNDLTNLEALHYVRDRLRRLGVDKALARAGARPGDTVRIGQMTLEYSDDSAVRPSSRTGGRRR
jgi:GTP-binding protein